jgi:hypothetical protein
MVDGCEILHQLIGGKHPTIFRVSQPSAWWCRISSIHSMFNMSYCFMLKKNMDLIGALEHGFYVKIMESYPSH